MVALQMVHVTAMVALCKVLNVVAALAYMQQHSAACAIPLPALNRVAEAVHSHANVTAKSQKLLLAVSIASVSA
jgi:hypothetical protein